MHDDPQSKEFIAISIGQVAALKSIHLPMMLSHDSNKYAMPFSLLYNTCTSLRHEFILVIGVMFVTTVLMSK